MAKQILTNARLFTGGADLTSWSNKIEIAASIAAEDTTNYGSAGWKEFIGGLRETMIVGEGQWEAGDAGKVDNESWTSLGALTGWTICPHGAADGAKAYLTKVLRGDYALGDEVGKVAPWKANGQGSWPLVKGVIANPPGTARTATGNGTAVQLGAVADGQYLYAALHVLSVAGTSTPTITVKIQSDDNSGFSSATDQLTFTAATAIGGQILRAAGPITDDYFRASWAVSGTDPSFLVCVSFGIA